MKAKIAKQKKRRKISETERTFYRLGFLNGEQRLERTIELLRTTNGILWDELTRLDRDKPVVGVLLPYDTINRIITGLSEKGGHRRNRILIRTLKKMKAEARKADSHSALMDLEAERGH